jgi:hypothetical protein
MKPLSLSLSLAIQSCKRIVNKEYSKAFNAQDIAKQIFGIKLPFVLEEKAELSYGAPFGSVNAILGEYYWQKDIERIYCRRIRTFCEKYELDYNSVIQFCLCHETGHAKEQRLFEEIDFFPNTITWRYHPFISGICDYSVNKELLKNDIKNPFERKAFLDKETLRTVFVNTKEAKDNFHFNSLLNLPYNIDAYEHGGLSDDEKIGFKESQEKEIGDKWEKALSKLRSIDFFEPKSKLDIILDLYNEILEIPVPLCKVKTEILRLKFQTIPKFWRKSTYNVIFL